MSGSSLKDLIRSSGKVSSSYTSLIVVYHTLHGALVLGTPNDIFASRTQAHLQMEFVWSQFRLDLREVYSTKTGVGARHDKAIAQRQKAGKKVGGRKEEGNSNRKQSQNPATSGASKENMRVSQSSTSLYYNVSS